MYTWACHSGNDVSFRTLYLSHRSFSVSVSMDSHISSDFPLSCGVPEGSVIGPIFFNLYTTPLSTLISQSSLSHHFYADDTQLLISFVLKTLSLPSLSLRAISPQFLFR